MEYFLCPLLTRNKNAQLGSEVGAGRGGKGSATLLSKLLGQSAPTLAKPSPFLSRAPKHPVARSQGDSFPNRESRRRSLDARVTEPVFVWFKKQILSRPSLPTPGGIGGSGSRGPAWKVRIKEEPSTTCQAS